ncbi:MAG: hypothetical protein D3923_16595, partial [Candidatus Electrothrix sp. AR3]|nr:hypothetical protein [Candidatus Electrothrix sp. AR3]
NSLLQINGPMWWISIAISLVITWGALALALGFGAIHAAFKVESRAAVQGSFGTMVFMFTGLALELFILVIGFMGNYRLLKFWLRGNHLDALALLQSVATLISIIVITLVVSGWSLQKGMRTLDT